MQAHPRRVKPLFHFPTCPPMLHLSFSTILMPKVPPFCPSPLTSSSIYLSSRYLHFCAYSSLPRSTFSIPTSVPKVAPIRLSPPHPHFSCPSTTRIPERTSLQLAAPTCFHLQANVVPVCLILPYWHVHTNTHKLSIQGRGILPPGQSLHSPSGYARFTIFSFSQRLLQAATCIPYK